MSEVPLSMAEEIEVQEGPGGAWLASEGKGIREGERELVPLSLS